jgi:hypothetical protein
MKSQLKWKDSKLYTSVASHQLHSANFQLVNTYKRNGKNVLILINYKGIKGHINYTNDEFASNWTKQMFMLETFFLVNLSHSLTLELLCSYRSA